MTYFSFLFRLASIKLAKSQSLHVFYLLKGSFLLGTLHQQNYFHFFLLLLGLLSLLFVISPLFVSLQLLHFISFVKIFQNSLGAFYGILFVLMTTCYLYIAQRTLDEHKCTELQLLLYESPLVSLILVPVALIAENYSPSDPFSVFNADYHIRVLVCPAFIFYCVFILYFIFQLSLTITALVCVLINVSTLMIIHRTSILTFVRTHLSFHYSHFFVYQIQCRHTYKHSSYSLSM